MVENLAPTRSTSKQVAVVPYHFIHPFNAIHFRAHFPRVWYTGQLIEVAEPATRLAATADTLRFAETTRLEFAIAKQRIMMHGEMAAPGAKRS